MQSDALSSRDGGYSKAAMHLMESNPYRPKTPLKESIDKLRGQIQALQKLQSIHVQDPLTQGTTPKSYGMGAGSSTSPFGNLNPSMGQGLMPFQDPAMQMTAKMMSDMSG